jgi:hypothetical protein
MKLRYLLLLAMMGFWLADIQAQTVLSVRVSAAEDDLEEYIPGPNQTKTLGSLDPGSSDLELGAESADNKDPQLVGVRFRNIEIPAGSLILGAYIQFAVDNNNKNFDPCDLTIQAEQSGNPAPYDSNNPFNISSRAAFLTTVDWSIPNGSWMVIGEAGGDQRSPDIASLISEIIAQPDWASGNAMAFMISGTGLREAESFDGSPDNAPQLVIRFIAPKLYTGQVASSEDDLEEYIPGPNQTKTVGSLDPGSSDLELGAESANNVDPQLVGIRIANVDIPAGSVIKSAYLQFTVDNNNKNSDPSDLTIHVQDDANPVSFDANIPFNISSRPLMPTSVAWGIPTGSWSTIGESGPDQRSTDIGSLVQAIVDRTDWQAGNAMAFMISGTGLREAESFDGSPDNAARLIVEFFPQATLTAGVSTSEDDLEEYIAGPGQTKTVGTMDPGSSDLELGAESSGNVDPQLVGIRFANLGLQPGAVIQSAYIQFTVDNNNKNSDPVNLVIRAQDDVAPLSFDNNIPFNISSRPTLSNSVNWSIPDGSWTVIGEAGPDQRSADIGALVQELVNRPDWAVGGAMVFTLEGTGLRESESFDGSPDNAPKLIVNYLSSDNALPPLSYPIAAGSRWSYSDSDALPSADWFEVAYDESAWASGTGPLGYGFGDVNTATTDGTAALYLRTKVLINDLNELTDELELNLRSDDGAIVYINGQEILRTNMPGGAIDHSTPAEAVVTGNAEAVYFVYDIPKSAFQAGVNVIAVEVHQASPQDADIIFDLSIQNKLTQSGPFAFGCEGPDDLHISCFESLIPRVQNDTLEIPSTHAFQYLARKGEAYLSGSGSYGDNFDFTGYAPLAGSSKEGFLAINHEETPGGVSVATLALDVVKQIWNVTGSGGVNFSLVSGTAANCSGEVTPWGTTITCEETTGNNTDANGDGYYDLGWCIEINPSTRKILDYGTSSPQKLWALGRMSHENVKVLPSDQKTVYFGEDEGDGSVYKFIADVAGDLSSGQLFVLKVDQPLVNNEPVVSTGTWLLVPNTTKQERNDVKQYALNAGATTFGGVEDVDVSPVDGMVYFAVKGPGRVYRFSDDGTTVSSFSTFIGGQSYRINTEAGEVVEEWRTGNDNLTFDDRGNLYVLQDGGRNYVWMVSPDHTQQDPQVQVFFQTPSGAEPTGMTFTPDFRYMFLSVQSPNGTVDQTDITGKTYDFSDDVAIVIARKEYLGKDLSSATENPLSDAVKVFVFPNPVSDVLTTDVQLDIPGDLHLMLKDIQGNTLYSSRRSNLSAGSYSTMIPVRSMGITPGIYLMYVESNGVRTVEKVIVH